MAREGQREIWVYLEKGSDGIHENSLRLLPECKKVAEMLNGSVSGLLIGNNMRDIIPSIPGQLVPKTYCIDDTSLQQYNVQAFAHIIHRLVNNHNPLGLVFGATPVGIDLAPRIARKLGGSVISHCTALELGEKGSLIARRPIYGGNVDATLTSLGEPFVVTLDQRVFELEAVEDGKETFLEEVEADLDSARFPCEVIGRVKADPRDIDISEAEIVIGVGRGISNSGQLDMIEELGHLLGAIIGGTRPAVDEGWISPERQIGVSGKIIYPLLYLACGVSGAPHHLGGIKESKYIIAINADNAAPIFKVADLGIIGRVEEILPFLFTQIKNRKLKEN